MSAFKMPTRLGLWLKKLLIGGLLIIIIAFATLLAYVYKEISYSTSMPTSPPPETGRRKPLKCQRYRIRN